MDREKLTDAVITIEDVLKIKVRDISTNPANRTDGHLWVNHSAVKIIAALLKKKLINFD